MTKTYPAGALVRVDDIVRKPDGTPGLLPISASTWANWVRACRVPEGQLMGPRLRVWKIEDVLAAHDAEQAQEAQQAAGQEQDERAAFEAWAISYSTIPLKRDDDASLGFTGYTEMDQTMLWDAWQARAARAQRREPLTDEQIAEGRYLTWAAEPEDAPEAWSFFRGARWAESALAVRWGVKLGATTGKGPSNV